MPELRDYITLASSPMEQSDMAAHNETDSVGMSVSPVQNLLDLPPEIIFQIAKFLPTTSTASFALCNKKSAAQLGSRSWNLLSSLDSEDRIHFLSMLSRDLPRHHACHGCIRLHLSSSIPRPSNFNAPNQPDSCIPAPARRGYLKRGLFCISNYFSPYALRFSHVQLALKQHHYGLDHGVSLSDLSYTDVVFMASSVYLFSVDARIASNEMVVRSQEWVISSQDHPREQFLSKDGSHAVCQHLMTYNCDFDYDDRLTTVIRCRLSHGAADEGCACMGLHQCPYCPIEYQIDVVDCGERGTALCATKWSNLGAGLTTSDSKWRGHNLQIDDYVFHDLPLGSIRSSYESQEAVSVDDLTAENRKKMLSSLRIGRLSECFNPYGYEWKQAAGNMWYIGPPQGSNTMSRLFHRFLASHPRILHLMEVIIRSLILFLLIIQWTDRRKHSGKLEDLQGP